MIADVAEAVMTLAALPATEAVTETAQIWRTLFLMDHTVRLVTLTVAALGAGSGLVGTLLLLRRRALLGDTLAHSMLPGVVIAFLMLTAAGADGRNLALLLVGAGATGLIGVGLTLAIARTTRLGDDAAMAIVLGGLFGLGVALLGVAQHQPGASAAGLATLIYGKAAAMLWRDALLIGTVSLVTTIAATALLKEFRLLCFDEAFARAQGWPVARLDIALVLLVTAIAAAGLQAVGLILVVALLIIPAAAARFWSDRLAPMVTVAALLGAASGWIGTALSALLPKLPTGSVIVLVAAALFLFSALFGRRRGVLVGRRAALSIAAPEPAP